MNDEALYSAFKKWEELSASSDHRLAYEARVKEIMDNEAALRESELRQQGNKKKGEIKGREAAAKRLLRMGMDFETVVEASGIDKERMMIIQQENQ